MTEPPCEMCGMPAEPTPLGAMLCPTCQSRQTVYRCIRCGQRVIFGECVSPDHPELVSRVCSTCALRERAEKISAVDMEAIRAAARGGVIPAVKLAFERLGWSLNEAAWLVHEIRSNREPGATGPC